jgi:hypothetical protein
MSYLRGLHASPHPQPPPRLRPDPARHTAPGEGGYTGGGEHSAQVVQTGLAGTVCECLERGHTQPINAANIDAWASETSRKYIYYASLRLFDVLGD